MTLYTIATEAIRKELVQRHPLKEGESVSVHIRGGGPAFDGRAAEVVITRMSGTKLLSEEAHSFDHVLY